MFTDNGAAFDDPKFVYVGDGWIFNTPSTEDADGDAVHIRVDLGAAFSFVSYDYVEE